MKICKCGCNKEVKEKNKNYIKRHRPKIFCGCGCGELIKNGRYKIGHIPLNLCLCGCGQKCSGKYIKEHYYKIRIGKTYYILNCKNCGKTIERLISKQIFCNKICFNIWQKGKNNNPLTGKKFEDYYGEQKSKDIKQKQSLAKKGITYEQRFGEEKSDIIKQNMKNGRKHLTYEERFGEEKANELKDNIRKSVSKAQKGVKESEKTKKLLSIIQKQKAKERYKNEEYYNKIIYHLAHINNGNPTRLENILEYILKNEFIEYEIKSQYKVGKYILDFAIEKLKLGFEADGDYWHKDKEKDGKRDKWLSENGWTIKRFNESFLKDYAKNNKI